MAAGQRQPVTRRRFTHRSISCVTGDRTRRTGSAADADSFQVVTASGLAQTQHAHAAAFARPVGVGHATVGIAAKHRDMRIADQRLAASALRGRAPSGCPIAGGGGGPVFRSTAGRPRELWAPSVNDRSSRMHNQVPDQRQRDRAGDQDAQKMQGKIDAEIRSGECMGQATEYNFAIIADQRRMPGRRRARRGVTR